MHTHSTSLATWWERWFTYTQKPEEGTFFIDLVSSAPDIYNLKNIPFRISVNLDKNQVTVNHRRDSAWGIEKLIGSNMPLVAGEAFKMTVFAETNGFEVGVDGTHYVFFEYQKTVNMSVQFNSERECHWEDRLSLAIGGHKSLHLLYDIILHFVFLKLVIFVPLASTYYKLIRTSFANANSTSSESVQLHY